MSESEIPSGTGLFLSFFRQRTPAEDTKAWGVHSGRSDALSVVGKCLGETMCPRLEADLGLDTERGTLVREIEDLKRRYAASRHSHQVIPCTEGSSCTSEACQQTCSELANTFHVSATQAFGSILDEAAVLDPSLAFSQNARDDGSSNNNFEDKKDV